MEKPKIYIDGQSGTTGLQIFDRIGSREDLELIIAADTKNGQNWAFEPSEALTVIDTEIDGIPCDTDVNTGMSRIMIANSQGAVLPSTGGEGTGRLYLAGSVMIVLAGLWGLKERFS